MKAATTTPRKTRSAWLPWICLLVYAALCVTAWTHETWLLEWDSAIYLLTGRSLAEGAGYLYQGGPFFLRPPGLAWLLSPLSRGGEFEPLEVNRLVMLFAGTSILAVYIAVRQVHGRWLALGVALLTGTCPLFVLDFNKVYAEFPFLTAVFLGLACVHRSTGPGRGWWAWALAGAVCLGAAYYLRTVAVVVLPGLLLLVLRRPERGSRFRPLLPVLAVAFMAFPWWSHARSVAAEAPLPSEQLLLHDYQTALLHVDPGDPRSDRVSAAGWGERIHSNGAKLLRTCSNRLLGSDAVALLLLLSAFGSAGLLMILRRRPGLFECFFLVYLLVVLTYFVFNRRLLLPLIPLLYLYLLKALSGLGGVIARAARNDDVGRSGETPRFGVWAPAVVVAGLLVFNVSRLPRVLKERTPSWMSDLHVAAQWVRENTTEDAVILTLRAPQLALLTGRRTYSYRYFRGDDILDRYGVDYTVLAAKRETRRLRGEIETRVVDRWTLPGRTSEIEICRLRR